MCTLSTDSGHFTPAQWVSTKLRVNTCISVTSLNSHHRATGPCQAPSPAAGSLAGGDLVHSETDEPHRLREGGLVIDIFIALGITPHESVLDQ